MENLELILQNFDLYSILEIPKNASAADIKRAYYRKSLQFHPDKNGDSKNFYIINLAYKILSHPENRQKYDLEYYGNLKLTEMETNLMNLKYADYPIVYRPETIEKLKSDFNKLSLEIVQEEKKKREKDKNAHGSQPEVKPKKVSPTLDYVEKKVEDNLKKYKDEDAKLKEYLANQNKIKIADSNYFNNYFLKLKEKNSNVGINVNEKTNMELIPYNSTMNFSAANYVSIKDNEWEEDDVEKEINIVEDVNTYSFVPTIQKELTNIDLRSDVIHSRKSIAKEELNRYSNDRNAIAEFIPSKPMNDTEFKKKISFGFEGMERRYG